MRHILLYNESIKYQYFSADEIDDIRDIFQDIIDEYNLNLDFYANKNTYYISYYNGIDIVNSELTTNMNYVKRIIIDINVSDRERAIKDINQIIDRYRSMGYDATLSYLEKHLLIKIRKVYQKKLESFDLFRDAHDKQGSDRERLESKLSDEDIKDYFYDLIDDGYEIEIDTVLKWQNVHRTQRFNLDNSNTPVHKIKLAHRNSTKYQRNRDGIVPESTLDTIEKLKSYTKMIDIFTSCLNNFLKDGDFDMMYNVKITLCEFPQFIFDVVEKE